MVVEMKDNTNYVSLSSILVFLSLSLFFLSIPIKISADFNYYNSGVYPSYSIFRHIFMLVSFILITFNYMNKKVKGTNGKKLFTNMISLITIFMTLSLFLIVKNEDFAESTISSFYFVIVPILFSYFLINSVEMKKIDFYFKTFFCIISLMYIIDKFSVFMNIENIFRINFFESYSPFESSAYSGYFYGFMIYLCIVQKDKVFGFLSVLMVFLTFKRINTLVAIPIYVIACRFKMNKKVSKYIINGITIMFILLPIFEYRILIDSEALRNIAQMLGFYDSKGLVMGRDYFVELLVNNNFESLGFGSIGSFFDSLVGKKGIELDLVQIYIELGIIGISSISITFWQGINRDILSVIILFVFFINMLTSYQLTDSYALFFNTITLYYLQTGKVNFNESKSDYNSSLL